MRLYHCKNTRSFRVLWTLEELGLTYDLVNIDFPPRETFPGFHVINPLGTVPVLADGDLILTESSGICLYLGEKYGSGDLIVRPADDAYGDYVKWLFASDTTLTSPLVYIFRYRAAAERNDILRSSVDDHSRAFASALKGLEEHLKAREYLCGGKFTIADIAIHFALLLGESLNLVGEWVPNCHRYLTQLQHRDAFQRASALESAQSDAILP